MFNFGVGQLIFTPPGSNPTPLQIATLQECSLEVGYTDKELYGQFQFPEDVARAQAKLSIKAKFARINGSLFSQVLTGSTSAGGYTKGAINEAGTIPATPFQITVTNSATYSVDCGVVDLTSGLVLTRVASAPATGQYSVAAGVYTFASADTGHSVFISYGYTVATVGKTVSLTNQLMGSGTSFSVLLFNIFRSSALGYKLYAVTIPKLTLPLKNEDYTIMDIDGSCYADSSARVMDVYTSE